MESRLTGSASPSLRSSSPPFPHSPILPFLLAALAALALSGCATPAVESARYNYYAGRYDKADESLTTGKVYEKDRVLVLLERGMVRQASGRYEDSSQDWIEAYDQLERLETYSLSKGSASLIVNDGVQDFRGTPFERTLLHAFTAKNHLARADWENAAVEARRLMIALDPAKRGEFPEDAYSRYLAGFCLEMIDDPSNAALQYRLANALLTDAEIDERTGYLRPKAAQTNAPPHAGEGPADPPPWPAKRFENELVCFVLLGRSPGKYMRWDDTWKPGVPQHAEIHHKGKLLGRSCSLADTADLAFETAAKEAALKAAKTVTRVVLKEVAAEAIAHETNDAVGDLVRILLIGILETPDLRRWETLPRWLQVARVPCPPDLAEYDVVVKDAGGRTIRTMHVEKPIAKRRNIFVSFCRDMPPSGAPRLPAAQPAAAGPAPATGL